MQSRQELLSRQELRSRQELPSRQELRLMRHAIEHDIKPNGIAIRREAEEELGVLPFTLPRVGDVGVVRHHHHQPAVLVADAAEVRLGAQLAAL